MSTEQSVFTRQIYAFGYSKPRAVETNDNPRFIRGLKSLSSVEPKSSKELKSVLTRLNIAHIRPPHFAKAGVGMLPNTLHTVYLHHVLITGISGIERVHGSRDTARHNGPRRLDGESDHQRGRQRQTPLPSHRNTPT